MHTRLLVCAVLFACWTAAIEARLFFLQVVDHADLMARADRQQMRTVNPPAKRGEIMDRNGRVLAYSVDADTLAADPSEIDDPDAWIGFHVDRAGSTTGTCSTSIPASARAVSGKALISASWRRSTTVRIPRASTRCATSVGSQCASVSLRNT